MKMHIRKDDTVIVISGDDKGVKGKVMAVSPEEGKVIVEKVNVQTKHVKARKQNDPSGIMKVEGALYADKVMLYCDKCKAGRRVKTLVETTTDKNGKTKKTKIRVCANCGSKF